MLSNLSPIGLGGWAFGGPVRKGWGDQRDSDTRAAIYSALECGVNWIDTAPAYGLGYSEQIIGKILKSVSTADRPHIFTKCGPRWNKSAPTGCLDIALSGTSITYELERSLHRLGVDHVSGYMVHCPPGDMFLVEEYWDALSAIKREGKALKIGLSNHNPELMQRAHSLSTVDFIQTPLSILARHSLIDAIPWSKRNNVFVHAYSPLQSGLLSRRPDNGKYENLAASDWRRQDKGYQQGIISEYSGLYDVLENIAQRSGVSVSTVSVAWANGCEGVSGAIVGARNRKQVLDICRSQYFQLSYICRQRIDLYLENNQLNYDYA